LSETGKIPRGRTGRFLLCDFWSVSGSVSFLGLLFALSGFQSRAQIQTDTAALRHENMRQGINTFSVGTAGDWRTSFSGSQKLQAQTGQYLIYNRALPNNRFITNNLWTQLSHRVAWRNRISLLNEAWQFSFVANQTRIAQYMTRVRYHLIQEKNYQLFLQAGGGFMNDKRLANNNSGLKGEAQTEFYSLSKDSTLSMQVLGLASVSNLSPRNNQKILTFAGISKEFPGGGLLALNGGYLKSKVEDYLGQDIQSIISDTVFSRLRIRIPLSPKLIFSSENEFQTPNRSFFYRNKESGTETRNVRYFQDEYQSLNALRILKKKLRVEFSFESRLRNRTYDILNRLNRTDPLYNQELLVYNQKLGDERIKDIREQYSTYKTDARWRISSSHSLRLNYVAQLLRVDTRSDLNNQDRDEILYAGELAHDWNFPFGFRLTNKISGSLRHLVFIEASQSSENYKDRILRWEPSLRWNYRRLSWTGQMGIWATYQVRDFEGQQDKNRSNRILLFNHQIEYRLASRWRILAELLRRENRLSQLNWEKFSESPIDTVTLYDLAVRSQYLSAQDFNGQWSVQLGYRAFWQVRKSRASLSDPSVGAKLIYLKSYFVQQGPQLKFLFRKDDRILLQGELWLQWSEQFFAYSRSDKVYLGNNYTPEQLASRDRRFLPFFSLQGTWYFTRRKIQS
jgi:hypothetical protein